MNLPSISNMTPKTLIRALGQFLFYWLPVILWLAIIYVLSNQPSVPHPGRKIGLSDYVVDYTAHALTFGFLTLLLWRALRTWRGWRDSFRPLLGAGLLAALYALSDEIHQSFVPGRTASAKDWLADTIGILVMCALLALWQRWRARHKAGKAARSILTRDEAAGS